MRTIVVVDYDPSWPAAFEQVRARVWPAVSDIATSIEHVGSTAVPGLAAKPIIDVSVVVPSDQEIPLAILRLAALGYVHRGTLGVPQREAFDSPEGPPEHHLYLCPSASIGLANHLAVRDSLRADLDAAREYGALKKRLADRFPHDIKSYVDGKTDFLLSLLQASGSSGPRIRSRVMPRSAEAVRMFDQKVERGMLALVLPWGLLVGLMALGALPIPDSRDLLGDTLFYGTMLAGFAATAALAAKVVPGAGRYSFLRRVLSPACAFVACELVLHVLEWLGVGRIALKQMAPNPTTMGQRAWAMTHGAINLVVPIATIFGGTWALLGTPRRPYGRGGRSSSPASSPPISCESTESR